MQNIDLFEEVAIRKSEKALTITFVHLTQWDKSSPWWFNGAISNVSDLMDVSLQSLAGNLITKASDKFFPKTLWLTRPKEILSVNCLLFCPWSTMIFLLLLFSPSALNCRAHGDLKMLFMIESYTYFQNVKCVVRWQKVISLWRT